jgi:TPR repeat protein
LLDDAIEYFENGNYQKAYDIFYDLALCKKNDEAMFYLGIMYYDGNGIDKDESKAKEWWKKSANRGNLDAKFRLESINMSTSIKF